MAAQHRIKRLLSSSAIVLGMTFIPMQAALAVDDLETPIGEVVVGGSASFDRPSDGLLNIHQNTDRVVIDWESFNIGGNATTEFFQPGSNSLAVNRVTGRNSDPTQILGKLKANGQVMVLDRNGVIFGKNAVIDVGGIVASTGNVDTNAVMRGDQVLELSDFGDGEIINNGMMNISDAGLAAFVAPTVINNGIINAKLGKVALSTGGERATVDLYGDGLVEIALDSQKTNALVKNAGVINAEGGTVALSASAAKEAVDEVINMSGVVKVSSVTVKGGKIILSGGKSGTVNVSGDLDASGKNGGGNIDVTGQNINVTDAAEIKADAIENGDGGLVHVIAQDHADFRGSIYARGGSESGNGGFAEVSGYETLGYTGFANLGAAFGLGGTLLLDPTFAVIHSGAGTTNDPIGMGIGISAQALANSMETNTNVLVQADNYIDVGAKDSYSGGNAVALNALGKLAIDLDLFTTNGGGTTLGSLTLQSNKVNFNRDLTMGNGSVSVIAPNVDLKARIYDANGATELGDARLNSTATSVNVFSPARIQQGIELAAAGATVDVNAGNYDESITIAKALTLRGANAGTAGDAARVTETEINGTTDTAVAINASDVTFNGFKVVGDTGNVNDYGVLVQNSNNVKIINNIVEDASYGIFAYGGTPTKGEIRRNYVTGVDGQAIHIRDNQYFDIINNKIDDSAVGITTENFWQAAPDGTATEIKGNDITAKLIGIRNNLSYGTQSGFVISNNTIKADDPANTRRWTGIDVISQMDGVATQFINNDINGAGAGTRSANGYELTLMSNNNRATIDGGTIKNVDTGIWATDGSRFTGEVKDLLIQNVKFQNVDQTDILVEDVLDSTVPANTGINSTGTTVTIGTGNVFSGNFDIALAGSKAKVLLDGIAGVGKVLIKAASTTSHYIPAAPTVSTLSTDNAVIQNGVNIAAVGGEVHVEAGSFTENVTIARSMKLLSLAGRALTTITGISNVGALGTITLSNNANDVTIGDVNKGFTIVGIDNGVPGIENAAIYVQGNHDNVTIRGNDVRANGDEALVTEYSLVNSDMVIDQNIFSGKTYIGVAGTGNQFVDPNVPRQLVALNNGLTNITFTGNTITGDSGLQHLVAIESVGGTVSGNVFTGTTTNANLRVRGNAEVFDNNITGTGNDRGIWITGDGTNVHDNTIHGVKTGIYAGTGVGATIAANIIYDTAGDGIKLDGSQSTKTNGNFIGYSDNVGTRGADDNIKGYGIYDYLATGTLEINNNKIADTTQHGIFTQWGTGTLAIKDNDIDSVDGAGIYLEGSTIAQTVEHNFIDDAGQDGIHAWNTNGAQITLNEINGAADGIEVESSQGTNIATNTVKNTTGYGISVHDTTLYGGLTVDGNIVNSTGDDGIHIANVVMNPGNFVKVNNNKVGLLDGVDNITGDGIEIINADGVEVKGNTVSEAGGSYGNGIVVRDSESAVIGGVGLERNTITNVAGDGIKLVGTNLATVENNSVDSAERIGVYTEFATNTTIKDNVLTNTNIVNTSQYGSIYTYQGSDFTITGNDIDDTKASGIMVYQAGGTNLLQGNKVDNVDGAGIVADGVSKLTVRNNKIGKNGGNVDGDGVYVTGSGGAQILGNEIEGVGADGIDVVNSNTVNIRNNNVKNAAETAIALNNSDGSSITKNDVNGGKTGIKLVDVINSTVGGSNADANTIKNIALGWNNSGINIWGGTNLQITHNVLTNNGGQGIVADGNYGTPATTLNIFKNDITNSEHNAIYLKKRTGATVEQNDIKGTTYGHGILLELSEDADVINNTIKNVAADGINLTYGDSGAEIRLNTITNAGANGIGTNDSDDLIIRNNDIKNAGDAGIAVTDSDNTFITKNEVVGGKTGIKLVDVTNSTVGGSNADANTIKNTASGWNNSGINILDGENLEVSYNTLRNIGGQGIYADGAYGAPATVLNISDNKLTDIEHNGIYLKKRNGADVIDNKIDGTTHGSGVVLELSENAYVIDNTIKNVADNGVALWYGAHNAVIKGNTIRAANDGVSVQQTGGQVNDFVTIGGLTLAEQNDIRGGKNGVKIDGGEGHVVIGNLIKNQSEDGIHVQNLSGTPTMITLNEINGQQDDGIEVTGSRKVGVVLNFIDDVQDNGVEINDSRNIVVAANEIGLFGQVGGNGVDVSSSRRILIDDNTIENINHDGVQVRDSRLVQISRNIINDVIGNGISVFGKGVSRQIAILRNQIGLNGTIGGDGISIDNTRNVRIARNEILGAGDNGLQISASRNVRVNNNLIENSGAAGLFAEGPDNGRIVLRGNEIISLAGEAGAFFESGIIDLTALGLNANTFTGGSIGLGFAPYNSGTIENPNFAPLSLVDDTIGETVFDAQSDYYVFLDNGAFFAPGSPTVIDGTHATYDTFRPDTVAFLTLAQYNAIESKIFHFNDDPTLGLFFFGLLEPQFSINQEDIFDTINGFDAGARGLSITIRGLPRIPGQTSGGAASFANIAPAAGGTSAADFANIAPAAGGDDSAAAAAAAAIEPAAGENQETSCWGDAAAGAASGATVTYSFGGDAESDMSAAAGCQTGSL